MPSQAKTTLSAIVLQGLQREDTAQVSRQVIGALRDGAVALALALPGITKDAQPRSVRVHDGWIFGLVLLGAGGLVVAVALALCRLEARRPLVPARRARVEATPGPKTGSRTARKSMVSASSRRPRSMSTRPRWNASSA